MYGPLCPFDMRTIGKVRPEVAASVTEYVSDRSPLHRRLRLRRRKINIAAGYGDSDAPVPCEE